MSNDPNKLAWKGTQGEWKYKNDGTYHGLTVDDGNDIIGYFGSMTSMSEENEANSYMASAAPEAVEFIADLMDFFDFLELLQTDKINIEPWRNKAETILKKAYNH